MRIGFFGGSFDPVHVGHLIIAEQYRDLGNLDQVWFVPSAVSPNKPNGPQASDRQRREMLEYAIAGHDSFRVSDVELKRGGTSFTVDSLREIRQSNPEVELFLIIGGDSLEGFSRWKDPAGICQLATPLVYQRPGSPCDLSLLSAWLSESRLETIQKMALETVKIDLSSTIVRQKIASGNSVRFLVPRSVEKYIQTTELYVPVAATS